MKSLIIALVLCCFCCAANAADTGSAGSTSPKLKTLDGFGEIKWGTKSTSKSISKAIAEYSPTGLPGSGNAYNLDGTTKLDGMSVHYVLCFNKKGELYEGKYIINSSDLDRKGMSINDGFDAYLRLLSGRYGNPTAINNEFEQDIKDDDKSLEKFNILIISGKLRRSASWENDSTFLSISAIRKTSIDLVILYKSKKYQPEDKKPDSSIKGKGL